MLFFVLVLEAHKRRLHDSQHQNNTIMSRTTFSIAFVCRESKKNKQGLAPIELSITLNGTRKFVNLPRKEKPCDFNRKHRNSDLEDYLSLMRSRVNSIMTEMIANGEPLTTEAIREYVKSGGYKSYTVGQLFTDYLKLLAKRVDVDLTMGVYRKYELVRNMFYKYISPESECTAITPALIKQVQVELYAKYDSATAAGYLTKLKTFIKFGMDNSKIKINPFQGVKIVKGKKDIVYLTEAELEAVNGLKIDNESLSNIRDAFILQASTGLAYIDIYNLKKEDIQIMPDGTHYICKNRVKTTTQYTSVIMPMGVEVLKKHDYQLHIISNQKYNLFLKTLQTMAGIKTTLTTHVARRTYATMLLNKGVRLETVSKCMGHRNVKITQSAYAQVLNKTVIDEVSAKI